MQFGHLPSAPCLQPRRPPLYQRTSTQFGKAGSKQKPKIQAYSVQEEAIIDFSQHLETNHLDILHKKKYLRILRPLNTFLQKLSVCKTPTLTSVLQSVLVKK